MKVVRVFSLPEVLGILLGSVIYTICSGNAKAFKQKRTILKYFRRTFMGDW